MGTDPIDRWLKWYSAGDVSPGTIELRRAYLRRYAATVPDLLHANASDVSAWLDNAQWGTETRRSARASVRSFYQWAMTEGVVSSDPSSTSRPIRPQTRIPKPIPEPALQRALLASTTSQELMLLLGAYAGLRRTEIASVHSDDVTPDGLLVRGKGRKIRRVPIHPRLEAHLSELNGWAFPSPRRPGEHCCPTYVRDNLNTVLPKPWTPHSLRHRFATEAFRACKDIAVVQQLLGHSKIETTMLYVLVEQDALSAAVLAVA